MNSEEFANAAYRLRDALNNFQGVDVHQLGLLMNRFEEYVARFTESVESQLSGTRLLIAASFAAQCKGNNRYQEGLRMADALILESQKPGSSIPIPAPEDCDQPPRQMLTPEQMEKHLSGPSPYDASVLRQSTEGWKDHL